MNVSILPELSRLHSFPALMRCYTSPLPGLKTQQDGGTALLVGEVHIVPRFCVHGKGAVCKKNKMSIPFYRHRANKPR